MLLIGLALVIIIISSINVNALRWSVINKISIMAMRILVISASSYLSWAVLWITSVKLFCHWLIDGLSNRTIVTFSTVVILTH